jgi:CDP-6-deoxy-D-xylo-4-hexulose-3-dehydrase
MQAACGWGQLEQLDRFVQMRRDNYKFLESALETFPFLWNPTVYPDAWPSWFGFPISISPNAKFKRDELTWYLNEHQIGTRLVFAGNATKQPFLKGQNYRIHGSLEKTDEVMNNTFWVGVQPALTREMLTYVADTINKFIKDY